MSFHQCRHYPLEDALRIAVQGLRRSCDVDYGAPGAMAMPTTDHLAFVVRVRAQGSRPLMGLNMQGRKHMIYKGSCHCGRVAFEVEGELNEAMACNCSICSRKGSLLWFVPRHRLHLLTSEEGIGTYTFNKHVIKHRFCQICGIHPYGEGVDPKGNRMAAINIRPRRR
ncbi:hypothetical protein BH20PSE1_BH20PSE1_05140 [soil metagenome]